MRRGMIRQQCAEAGAAVAQRGMMTSSVVMVRGVSRDVQRQVEKGNVQRREFDGSQKDVQRREAAKQVGESAEVEREMRRWQGDFL